MSGPVFAVVGHPNKGKSSLVAALARDPSVAIGPEPGTTTHARRFPMRIGGETLYTLIDTPGFQRARAALEWMRRQEADAASRPRAVRTFVEAHADKERFRDERELLLPIVRGAGIIYVVDGAAPYGPEYDAEMEILRWTGRPSLAVINPIGEPRFVEPWRQALEQFFRIVRVLDVMQAPFEQQVELLRLFGHLADEWRQPLERATAALINDRRRQREDAARAIAEMVGEALAHAETKDLAKNEPPEKHASALEERYRRRLRQLERRTRTEVEAIYGYREIDRREAEMPLLEVDLLARESWLAFGLKRRDLVAAGTVSGAIAGGAFDAAVLGASLLTGSLVGGALGGAVGWFSSQRLADLKVLHQPLGGTRLRYGPTRNIQFPFVLLNRAWLHHTLVSSRTHAQRGALIIDRPEAVQPLPDPAKREFAARFERLRRNEPGSAGRPAALTDLAETIASLLEIDATTGHRPALTAD